jgi:hypothetical protein
LVHRIDLISVLHQGPLRWRPGAKLQRALFQQPARGASDELSGGPEDDRGVLMLFVTVVRVMAVGAVGWFYRDTLFSVEGSRGRPSPALVVKVEPASESFDVRLDRAARRPPTDAASAAALDEARLRALAPAGVIVDSVVAFHRGV